MMTSNDSNRRRFPRYEISGLAGHLVVPLQIEVLNLSLGGMAVATSSYLHFNRAYTLRLVSDQQNISLTGKVAWCALKGTSRGVDGEVVPVYRAGLRFEAMSGERAKELWDLIRSHAYVDVEDSVLGRFDVEMPTRTEMGSNFDFAVKKISLSGMLIETEFNPELDALFEMHVELGRLIWDTRARVASLPRVGRRSLGELNQIGMEFADLEPAQVAVLEKYIERQLKSRESS